jgi:hypothetical protein
MMNDDRCRRSSSGRHITVGDVVPQTVVVVGCCGSVVSDNVDGDDVPNVVTVRRCSTSSGDR